MKKYFVFLAFLFAPFSAFCQAGWAYLPLQSGNNQRFEDVYFVNKDTGHAVDLSGNIYKTTDQGATWNSLHFTGGVTFRSIEFLDDGVTGIAGSFAQKIYRTDNGGVTWTDISSSIPFTGYQSKTICGIAHYGDNFYGVGWWGSDTAKILKSTDKGITWTVNKLSRSLVNSLVDAVFLSADTGFVTGSKNTIGTANGNSQARILKTTDGGTTWTNVFADSVIGGLVWKIQALSHKVLVASIQPYYLDTVVMVKSIDGGNTWTEIGTGFAAPGPFSPTNVQGKTQGIGFINERRGWLGGWYGGMYETIDSGHTWNYMLFGTNMNRFFIIDSSHAFAGGQQMYKFTGDTTWPASVASQAKMPHDFYPISPNPSKGNVKLEFDLKTETNVVLEVANIDSRAISRIVSQRMKPGHYTYYWDGRNAPNGHYIVWLGTDEIPIVQKFVLER